MEHIGPWGWCGIALLTFWAVSAAWMVLEIRNAPDIEEYMSGRWEEQKREKRSNRGMARRG